jgi:hypothetical protein
MESSRRVVAIHRRDSLTGTQAVRESSLKGRIRHLICLRRRLGRGHCPFCPPRTGYLVVVLGRAHCPSLPSPVVRGSAVRAAALAPRPFRSIARDWRLQESRVSRRGELGWVCWADPDAPFSARRTLPWAPVGLSFETPMPRPFRQNRACIPTEASRPEPRWYEFPSTAKRAAGTPACVGGVQQKRANTGWRSRSRRAPSTIRAGRSKNLAGAENSADRCLSDCHDK